MSIKIVHLNQLNYFLVQVTANPTQTGISNNQIYLTHNKESRVNVGSRHGTSGLWPSFGATLLALALAGGKVATVIIGITYRSNSLD